MTARSKALSLIFGALTIGIFTDTLARQHIFGLNFLLWVTLWAVMLVLVSLRQKIGSLRLYAYIILALLNSLMVYVRAEPVVQFWSVVSSLVFLALGLGTLNIVDFAKLPLIARVLEWIVSAVLGLGVVLSPLAKKAHKKNQVVDRNIPLGPVIAVILVLIFIGLFSSSDAVFSSNFQWLGDGLTSFFDWLGGFNLGRGVSAIFWSFLALAGLCMAIATRKTTANIQFKLSKVISTKDSDIILIAVSAVFAFFVAIQFKYLFNGGSLPDGITYASYARKGYGELLLVTLLASAVLYITKTITRDAYTRRQHILSYILVALNTVVVLSAWKRLSLYESAYGWTMTRFIARIGLLCITLGLVVLAVWLANRITAKSLYAANWYILSLVLFLMSALNPIGIITAHNIQEVGKREVPLDTVQLLNQSPDSYKALCAYAPQLRTAYPQAYEELKNRVVNDQEGRYGWIKLSYSDLRSSGLSASFTSSSSFIKQTQNCLK